ncbi:MAG TPA: hypothetical protein VEL11_16830 [Candidatus Bathyarchaeia archaeon]|nr:hypothetical protein [Candidatus Bathyarchaeia archaeon]
MSHHNIKIPKYDYDKDNEKSQQKILLEYMKAIDALTINDEYRTISDLLNVKNSLIE